MSINLSALQRQRSDTAANWTAENPTLLAGEIGLESDTGYWKVGDGATAWTSLAYVSGLGAEIPVDRLADGAARQLLQTDAAGTGVEWTNDVDVPGTLDVTGLATFDENINLAATKEIQIASTKVLDASGLGSTVLSSSLTSVGTIGTGTWQGSAIDVAYGGTGQTSYVDGELLIGNSTGNTLNKATLTAGSGVTITNGNGSIEISATGSGGSVTSVDVSGGTGLTSSGGPITTSGTITIDLDDTAVTPGSYTYASLTVDQQGRITAASSGTAPLTSGDIGISVQSYDANTAKYDDTTANFTGTLQNSGSDVVVDSDIGVTVQAYDADTAKLDVAQTFTAVQTLTDPAIVGTILEDVYTITDGASFEVDPSNGSVQLITLGANRTPKATNFAAGESVTLMVDDGTAYTLTWTDSTWGSGGVTWVGGSAPTLATSGYTVIQFWKVSTTVYGAYVGDVA